MADYVERRTVVIDPYYDAPAYGGDYGYESSGWLVFAGLMIFFTGLWNGFEGFIALFRSAYFSGTPVVGTLVFWSVVWIGLGILQISAAYAIFSGRNWARWFGIVLVAGSTLIHMASIPLYPWWSIIVIAFNLLILYALAVHWPHEEKEPQAAGS
jgi:hypothetical protein